MGSEDKCVFQSRNLPNKRYAFFKSKREEFCDVTFNVGERSISAHRIILSAAIPYFYGVFCEKEGVNSQGEELKFPIVDPDALVTLIDFAYTCQIEINDGNVKELLSAACLLRVDEVKDECCRFLMNRLRLQNVISTHAVLCKLGISEHLKKVNSYFRHNLEEVSHTPEFLDVSIDVLQSVIESDDLKVKSEEDIFEILMKWVKQCPEERQPHLPHLLRSVRMPFIKPSYIRNHILKEELIRTSTECRDLVDEALYFHAAYEKREVCSFVARPRNLAGNTHTDDGISRLYALHFKVDNVVQSLGSENAKWQTSRDLYLDGELVYPMAAAECNKRMYVFFPSFTAVYDMKENTLSVCNGMSLPRFCTGSVSLNNKLCVMGGFLTNEFETSDDVECLDPNTEEWTRLAGMRICRAGCGAVASTEFIYLLGGTSGMWYAFNDVENYNPQTGISTTMPPMLSERCFPGCAMLNDKIYVCGGLADFYKDVHLSTAEAYDPVVNEWKFISAMNTARAACKLVPFGSKLYCIAGQTKDGKSSIVEIYEVEEDKWKLGPPVDQSLSIVGVAVVNMP